MWLTHKIHKNNKPDSQLRRHDVRNTKNVCKQRRRRAKLDNSANAHQRRFSDYLKIVFRYQKNKFAIKTTWKKNCFCGKNSFSSSFIPFERFFRLYEMLQPEREIKGSMTTKAHTKCARSSLSQKNNKMIIFRGQLHKMGRKSCNRVEKERRAKQNRWQWRIFAVNFFGFSTQ